MNCVLKGLSIATILGIAALSGAVAHAAVLPHADVNGLGTFEDTNTGLVWVKLDNFFGMTYLEMKAAVEAAGFTVANRSEVQDLLDSLPIGNQATWTIYAGVMGDAPNRDLIWGAYAPEGLDVSWAYAYSTDSDWIFEPNSGFPLNVVPNDGTEFEDMNIWAYQGDVQAAVPEPTSMAIFGLGAIGLLRVARRRRKA
jgi:hypothetical protein